MDRCFQLGELSVGQSILGDRIKRWRLLRQVVYPNGCQFKIDSEKQEDQGLIHILKMADKKLSNLKNI